MLHKMNSDLALEKDCYGTERTRHRDVSSCLCNLSVGIIFPQLLLSSKGPGREMAEWAKHFPTSLRIRVQILSTQELLSRCGSLAVSPAARPAKWQALVSSDRLPHIEERECSRVHMHMLMHTHTMHNSRGKCSCCLLFVTHTAEAIVAHWFSGHNVWSSCCVLSACDLTFISMVEFLRATLTMTRGDLG